MSSYSPEFATHLAFLRAKHARADLALAMADAQALAAGTDPRAARAKALTGKDDKSSFMGKDLQQLGAPIHFVAVSATCSFLFWWVGTVMFPDKKALHYAFAIIGMLFGFILETSMFVIRDYHESQGEAHQRKAEARKESMIKAQLQRTMFPHGRSKQTPPQQTGPGTGAASTENVESSQTQKSSSVPAIETKKDR